LNYTRCSPHASATGGRMPPFASQRWTEVCILTEAVKSDSLPARRGREQLISRDM